MAFATVPPGFLAADVGPNFEPRSAIYRTPTEAEAQALVQVGLYESWEQQGRIRLIKTVDDLEQHLGLWRGDRKPGLVLLMEGADSIVKVDDLSRWWARGLRMIGLTFGDTRYGRGTAGGSARPIPRRIPGVLTPGVLTPDGCALLNQMAEKGLD